MSEEQSEPPKESKLKWVVNDIKQDFHNIAGHVRKAEATE